MFTAAGAAPDKPAGVVAITFTDMRRRGLIDKMVLVDAVGERMPAVRDTMARKICAAYKDMDLTMTTLPADDVAFDPQAFRAAISLMNKGDVVTIFTPDDTHFEIALACVEAGLHALCAKPIVKRLEDHLALAAAAKKHGVLCAVEYHKRFDPIYVDARDRARAHLGPFSFFFDDDAAQGAARHLPRMGREIQRHQLLPQLASHGLAHVVRRSLRATGARGGARRARRRGGSPRARRRPSHRGHRLAHRAVA